MRIAKAPALGVFFSAVLAACGGGSGGTDNCVNIAGTWNSTEVVDETRCNGVIHTEYRTFTITQVGCDVTVTFPGASVHGTVSGNKLSMTGNYPDDSGTITITGSDVALLEDGTVKGTASWTWNGSSGSCNGTTGITLTSGAQQPSNPAGVDAFCTKAVQCQLTDQQTCESLLAPLLLGVVPDPDHFQTCVQSLQCSELMDQTAVQGCLDIDDAATRCNADTTTLHACAQTGRCIDVTCSTACGYLGQSFDHCGFDPSKNHDVCFCR